MNVFIGDNISIAWSVSYWRIFIVGWLDDSNSLTIKEKIKIINVQKQEKLSEKMAKRQQNKTFWKNVGANGNVFF